MLINGDIARITHLIREAVEAEILPRYQKLSEADISEKNPGDLVTIADVKTEHLLERLLTETLPGSLVIGEEAVSRNEKSLAALDDNQMVWVVDPVDGTSNFAKGSPCFATMVALCRNGEVLAGWIHDPLNNETGIAEQGSGAFLNGIAIKVDVPTSPDQLIGPMWRKLELASHENVKNGLGVMPKMIKHYGCVGHEYLDMAKGVFHFAQYGLLQPWDHAAGVLIHKEAGGFSALVREKTPYRAVETKQNRLLLAPNEENWDALNRLFNSSS